ncbi:IS4/Tn5 family transposase DNA-binding protein [Nostoc sp.]
MSIGYALSQGFGKALSEIFSSGTVLKRSSLSFCQPQSGICHS